MPLTAQELRFRPAQRKRRGEYRTCAYCGEQFYAPPARVKRNEQFCSRACYEAARAPKMVEKVCPVCGKTFSVSATIANRYTVCSRECRTASTKYQVCERCGKPFVAEKRLNRHYCSEECRRPPFIKNCATCDKEFRYFPGDIDRMFCSFACYRRFRGENGLERIVRSTLDILSIGYIQEAKMGRYSIDFLLADLRIALEVDGTYWHRDPKRDARKMAYLEAHGWAVCRITDLEIEHAKHLDRLIAERLQAMSSRQIPTLQPSLL